MKYPPILFLLMIIILGCLNCSVNASSDKISTDFKNPQRHKQFIHGVSFVAPPQPYKVSTFQEMKDVGINSIAVIPYGFMKLDEPTVHYDPNGKQWWGERPEGIIETIKDAHNLDIKVMLKPSVYMWQSWTGNAEFIDKEEIKIWIDSYTKYVLQFAKIADSLSVDLFCIGNEFKKMAISQPKLWRKLINEIRVIYNGPLTYASNWDEYESIEFWDDLDFVGINAYFPLSDELHPSEETLLLAWRKKAENIEKLHLKFNKPILFTEYGYMSVDQATHETWMLEKDRDSLKENQKLQADAYEALFKTFYNKPYWHGGFMWKWYPYEGRRSASRIRDYTPQGKLGEATLKKWFLKNSK